MNKKIYYLRIGIVVIIAALCLAAFAGIFYPVKIFDIQFVSLLQRILSGVALGASILFLLLLTLTFLFGRIYCSTLCPLGLFQEFLMFLFRRKNTPRKKHIYKYFIAAVAFGCLAGGSAAVFRLTDPYTLSGAAVSGSIIGLVAITLIMFLVWFRGRFFCTNICPVGTVLGLIAKHSFFKINIDKNKCISCGLCARQCPTGSIDFKNKTVDNETCIKCLKCLGVCRKNSLTYGCSSKPPVSFNPQRRQLLTGAAVIAVFAVAARYGVKLAGAASEKLKKIILPAGAGNIEDFAGKCLNCNLCVQNCPMKILKKASDDCPVVHIDYQNSFCSYDCHKCSEICPSGAIRRITLEEKQKTRIGTAVINNDACIKCGLCVMKCPRQIISKENGGFPQINSDECIGCGACQAACPVKAITVAAAAQQKIL